LLPRSMTTSSTAGFTVSGGVSGSGAAFLGTTGFGAAAAGTGALARSSA